MKNRIQSKKGRKSNYLKSLDNDYHREVRRKALIREGFKCKLCPSEVRLELHHISYEHQGDELNHMNEVVILCDKHHIQVHKEKDHFFNPKNRNKIFIDQYAAGKF